MQTIYKNETSLGLRWLMLIAGIVLLVLCAADYFAFWPVFGINQHLDTALLLAGSALLIIGGKEVTSYVREIAVDDKCTLTVTKAIGQATVPGDSIRTLTIYGSNKEMRRLDLAADRGTFTFPSKTFPADRIAETLKAINPAITITRRA
jgi:hypothetical protein